MPKKVATPVQANLFEQEPLGKRLQPDADAEVSEIYRHPHGLLFQGDSLKWLKTLESQTVDLIFADPPYNINKADWDKFESQERYIDWSMQWIRESHRVLKKRGHYMSEGFLKFSPI